MKWKIFGNHHFDKPTLKGIIKTFWDRRRYHIFLCLPYDLKIHTNQFFLLLKNINNRHSHPAPTPSHLFFTSLCFHVSCIHTIPLQRLISLLKHHTRNSPVFVSLCLDTLERYSLRWATEPNPWLGSLGFTSVLWGQVSSRVLWFITDLIEAMTINSLGQQHL